MQKVCTDEDILKNQILKYNLQWFAKDGEGGEKTEPATAKKLKDAREEGKVAKSRELNSAFGLIVLFLCLKIFVSYVGKKLIIGDPVQGFTTLAAIMLFLGGIQLLTIGILGEYIGRIFNETKRRPVYVVGETDLKH